MKRQAIVGVLAVIGTLALSAAVTHAGSGGTPSPLTSFFVCHGIAGDDAGQTVDVESPIFGNRLRVRIGKGLLACAFAKLFQTGTSTEIEPNPVTGHQELKCYSVAVSRRPGSTPPAQYTVTDELLGVDADVQASSKPTYICGPSTLTQ